MALSGDGERQRVVRPCQDTGDAYIFKLTWRQGGYVLILKALGLFVITAVAEIVGCYLPYLWLKKDGPAWLLIPAMASLALFAWLLTLHPTAAGRVYAAYGGVYVAVAIVWLWLVDGNRPTAWDLIGAAIAVTGMAVIMLGPRDA
jgi:small multidrug resistance family-3 protein